MSIQTVPINSIVLPRKWKKILRKDAARIEVFRLAFARGRDVHPVKLLRRLDGKFTIQDGRHRVLAAIQAEEPDILAEIN